MRNVLIDNDWKQLLEEDFHMPYYLHLRQFLKNEYEQERIFPKMNDLYQAFKLTPYEKVKVVILGQDPYHGEGQAHGLSFSVQPGVSIPPSLRNIFKELHTDIGCPIPTQGSLLKWAQEGVLLLNTVLSVREGNAHSHKGMGWEKLTDRVISLLNDRSKPVVFILWGRPAQAKAQLIDSSKHKIIEAPHPSPLSAHRGFFGSKPFSKANQYLQEQNQSPIQWCLP
jgi:uracil-DNA glycosylase